MSETVRDIATDLFGRELLQKERLIRERLCQDHWHWDRLGAADISEQSKYVETIPHVEKLYICHIDKNIYTGSGWVVLCGIYKQSNCLETKGFVLEFTSRAYEKFK